MALTSTRYSASGAPRKIWSDRDDGRLRAALDAEGLLAATGNRGRIYRIHETASSKTSRISKRPRRSALPTRRRAIYVGTANAGKLYLLSHGDDP